MKKSKPVLNRSSKAAEKILNEVRTFLQIIGCKVKKTNQSKYEVMCGREKTGLTLCFLKDFDEKQDANLILGVMNFPIPCNDNRFLKLNAVEEIALLPHLQVDFSDKKLKALFFEFLCHSIYYFQASKSLRKWYCHNCGKAGYEIFLDNGTIGTFDARCSEFRLLILNNDHDIEGAVYDDKIDEHVLPICGECREKIGYSLENDKGLEVDEAYFTRFLEKRAEGGRV